MLPKYVVLPANSYQLAVRQEYKTGWAEFCPKKREPILIKQRKTSVKYRMLATLHNPVSVNTQRKHVRTS
jgi:hypothetical protein